MDKFKQNVYYVLIACLSFLALVFLPMLNSDFDVALSLPSTPSAWAIWIASRLASSSLNVLIYHSFIKQGDINTRKAPERIQAELILKTLKKTREVVPLSPKKFFTREYCRKLPSIFLMTILSLLAFGPAIIKFDLVIFATYLATTLMAIILGVFEMKKVEDYYTEGLLTYALYLQEKLNNTEAENGNQDR